MKTNLVSTARSITALLAGAIVIACLAASGCGGQEHTCASCTSVAGTGTEVAAGTTTNTSPAPDRIAQYAMYAPADGSAPQYFDEHGASVERAKVVATFKLLSKDSAKSVGINVLEQPPTSDGARGFKVPFTCLWFDIRWDGSGYVGSCIKRNGPHLNIHLRDYCNNKDIFNLHAMGWNDNGPQFGLYESEKGWCWRSTGTWTNIRDRFLQAELYVGITGWVATAAADLAADATVAALF